MPIEIDEEESPMMYGGLQIGDFYENFMASLFEWTPEMYRQQWIDAAERLVNGESKSAFVTSFVPPTDSGNFWWWKCYRVDETVYVQNQLRFYDQLASPFHLDLLYDFV